jgi:hypothetical protein
MGNGLGKGLLESRLRPVSSKARIDKDYLPEG